MDETLKQFEGNFFDLVREKEKRERERERDGRG